jgi:hypothetical protein
MYVDVWSAVARRQVKVDKIETLWKTKLIKRSPKLTLLVAYYKVSNAMIKHLMKTKVQVTALLRRIGK